MSGKQYFVMNALRLTLFGHEECSFSAFARQWEGPKTMVNAFLVYSCFMFLLPLQEFLPLVGFV